MTETDKLTHWKSLRDDRFLGSYSLVERGLKELTVTIIDVKREKVISLDGKETDATIAYLKDEKPLWLNVTNQKTIEHYLKTPFIEKWIGNEITLYVEKVKINGAGLSSIEDCWVDALRIREFSTDEIEELDLFHPKWDRICLAVKSKTVTIEQLKTRFKLSDDTELLLMELLES